MLFRFSCVVTSLGSFTVITGHNHPCDHSQSSQVDKINNTMSLDWRRKDRYWSSNTMGWDSWLKDSSWCSKNMGYDFWRKDSCCYSNTIRWDCWLECSCCFSSVLKNCCGWWWEWGSSICGIDCWDNCLPTITSLTIRVLVKDNVVPS